MLFLVLTAITLSLAAATPFSGLQNQNDPVCVSPHPFFPAWTGPPIRREDCHQSWLALKRRLSPQSQSMKPIDWTFWYQYHPPGVRYAMPSPVDEIYSA